MACSDSSPGRMRRPLRLQALEGGWGRWPSRPPSSAPREREGGRSEAVRTWMEVINEKPRKCSPVQGSRRKEGDCMTGQIFPSQFCTWCLLISLELHARLSSGIQPAPVPSEVASHPGLQASLLLLALSQHCRAGL